MGQGHEPKLTDICLYRLQPLLLSRIFVFEQSKHIEQLKYNKSSCINDIHQWSIKTTVPNPLRVCLVAMEHYGNIPPDKDSANSYHHQPSTSYYASGQASSSSGLSAQHSTASAVSGATGSSSSSGSGQHPFERLSRPMSFDKMERLLIAMQEVETGVPVRSQKLFLTLIPSAFMGYDLIEWMMERLTIEESEALSIANQLCLHGYFFPISDSKTLLVKDDSSLYRFQTPYYWPWQHKTPDNVEYAIYLVKRSLRNKQRHGLEEYESEALASLHKNLKGKWDFITMQAEEQVRVAKDRKKGEKIVGDSQERAYWRVHRPPPGQFTPLEPCPIPSRDRQGKPRRRIADDWYREVDYLKSSMGRTRMKMSQACECLIQYCETFSDYDFFIQPVLPSNPWVSEDITFWQLNNTIVDIPTEKRVRRWAISVEELVSDPTGLQEFTAYLKKEYSHENIRFWIAVNDLRRSAHSQICKKVKEIYEEFLEPGAPCEINIDGKTMEKVQQGLKSPCRFTFDAAAEHIYALLLKKDCYPRFVRSEHYKTLLATGIQPSHKKRFFGFGVPKKKSSTAPPIQSLLTQHSYDTQVPGPSAVPSPGNLTRRRGSDRSLSGSAHELAVSGIKDGSSKVPHSHSQSNLSDIPYSVVIYRGDMPSCGGVLPPQSPSQLPLTSPPPPPPPLSTVAVEGVPQEKMTMSHSTDQSMNAINIAIATDFASSMAAVVAASSGAAVASGTNSATLGGPSEATLTAAAAAASVLVVVPATTVTPTAEADGRTTLDATHLLNQSDPKAVVEHLETTIEAPGGGAACAVCPWDTPDPIVAPPVATASAVSVSVCPWESETELPSHQSFPPPPSLIQPPKARNNSTNDSGSSSSDISEVSDRMRRSCGLRQNTVDCELFGPKRLAPVVSEQRRASMTIAPRLSDLQFSFQKQQSIQSPTMPKKPDRPLSAAQLTLNLTKTTSFEDRDDYSTAHPSIIRSVTSATTSTAAVTTTTTTGAVVVLSLTTSTTSHPTTISEELCEQCPPTNEVDANSAHNQTLSATGDTSEPLLPPPPPPQSTVNLTPSDTSTLVQSSLTPSSSSLSAKITPATTPSYGTTPTINVVCPIGEEEEEEEDEEEDEDEADAARKAANQRITGNQMDVDQVYENLAKDSFIIAEASDETMPATELDQLDVHDVVGIPQEELSPTTEEYQECCPPDDYQYDISTEGEILVPGCVAPAPTPAPSIAPLAEVEADPPDDELDIDESEGIGGVDTEMQLLPHGEEGSADVAFTKDIDGAHQIAEQTKRKRKKLNPETKTGTDSSCAADPEGAPILDTPQMETDAPCRNAVCPWEDDDVSSTADAPFVKTYATLGYL